MSDQRFIIEMGMGNDQYGEDYTKAALRAIERAATFGDSDVSGFGTKFKSFTSGYACTSHSWRAKA
jgi:hypothetical protein